MKIMLLDYEFQISYYYYTTITTNYGIKNIYMESRLREMLKLLAACCV